MEWPVEPTKEQFYLRGIAELEKQVTELRQNPLEITEYRLHAYRCSICGELVWAELPPGVVEGQLFGPRLQALIAYMKGSLYAPAMRAWKSFVARIQGPRRGPRKSVQRDCRQLFFQRLHQIRQSPSTVLPGPLDSRYQVPYHTAW